LEALRSIDKTGAIGEEAADAGRRIGDANRAEVMWCFLLTPIKME